MRMTTKTITTNLSSLPKHLINPSTGEKMPMDIDRMFQNKRVALYFSAGWCPMCTSFEPSLLNFRQSAQDAGTPIELIYVPSDRSEEASIQRSSNLNMMCVPFGDESSNLKKTYKIWSGSESFQFGFVGRRSGVPALVVLDKNGQELSYVPAESQGPKSLDKWNLNDQQGVWGSS